MDSAIFRVEVAIEAEDVIGLLVSGLEGGMFRGWGAIHSHGHRRPAAKWTLHHHLKWPYYAVWPICPGGSITVVDVEDNYKEYVLDSDAIARGLRLMANEHPAHFAQFLEENADEITGDVFIQLCTIGKLTYG